MYKKIKDRELILISDDFALNLLKKVRMSYGHIGVDKMFSKIHPFYYVKNLDSLVKNLCSNCDMCMRNKSRRSRTIGYLSQLGPAANPFEIVSLNTIGGSSGYNHFSRFAFTEASKGQQATDLIHFLKPIFTKYHIKVLLADQYSGINSFKLKNFLQSYNVTLVLTSVDCPFSNGTNEHLNQTIVNPLRCKFAENPKRPWTVLADECTLEYNKTVHNATKFSPQYLLTGKDSSVVLTEFQIDRDLDADRKSAFRNSQENP